MNLRKYFFQLFLRSFFLTIIIGSFTTCAQNKTDADQLKVVHPDWSKNATIYEVNIRQYTPEGTINAFKDYLPRLKEMGVDILWLMPVFPIGEKNRKATQTILVENIENPKERQKYLGSYYSTKDYYKINPEFGSEKDFSSLVNEAHKLGMFVILDIAVNHTAWDHKWITDYPEFYTKLEDGSITFPLGTDWWDTADLNFDNQELQSSLVEIFYYWIEEYDIDGYRCDVASWIPNEFWKKVRRELDKTKHVFMLAEANESYHHQGNFDMTYNWPLKDLMNAIAKGEKNASDIRTYYENEKTEYDIDAYRMTFTSNHDENSWHGTVFERLGDAAETFAVLTSVVKGMPLVYSGQEAGLDKRLAFFTKDQIEWKDHKFYYLYKTLFSLKHENKALWNGASGGEMEFIATGKENDVFSFSREKENDKIVAVFNLTNAAQNIILTNEKLNGEYYDLFTSDRFTITGNKFELNLNPFGYFIFVKRQ